MNKYVVSNPFPSCIWRRPLSDGGVLSGEEGKAGSVVLVKSGAMSTQTSVVAESTSKATTWLFRQSPGMLYEGAVAPVKSETAAGAESGGRRQVE